MRPNNEAVYYGNSIVASSSQVMLSECWVRASFQIDCLNGSLNGTFVVQASNDIAVGAPPNQFTPSNWNTIGSGGTATIIASVSATISTSSPSSSVIIPYFETCYQYHRLVYSPGNLGAVGSFSVRNKTISF